MQTTFTAEEITAKVEELFENREHCNCKFAKAAVKECPVHGDDVKYIDMYLEEGLVVDLNPTLRLAQLAHATEFLLVMTKIKNTIGHHCDGKGGVELSAAMLECMPQFDELLREIGYVPATCVLEDVSAHIRTRLPDGTIVIPCPGLNPNQVGGMMRDLKAALNKQNEKK